MSVDSETAALVRDARTGLRELGALMDRSSDGKLTQRARGIVQVINGLRALDPKWQGLYAARFERDLHEAVDKGDEPRMAGLLLSFLELAMIDMLLAA